MIDNSAAAVAAARAQGRPTWPFEPLYQLLHRSLPAFHQESGILDVPALAAELNVTPESIYRWFRAGKLSSASRARQLHTLMLSSVNAAALEQLERPTPSVNDLFAFCD